MVAIMRKTVLVAVLHGASAVAGLLVLVGAALLAGVPLGGPVGLVGQQRGEGGADAGVPGGGPARVVKGPRGCEQLVGLTGGCDGHGFPLVLDEWSRVVGGSE